MPVYFVTGKLGSGKTLSMVGRMREYLVKGRGVVTNVDLDVRALCDVKPMLLPIRLPDRPSVEDLLNLGAAHRTCREELNGCIVLDECGTWLNSRGWSDKGRGKLIDWLLHSRKLGWDVFFIIQNASMMDKQIRDALCEYHVTCRRLDRLKIPFIGRLIRFLSFGKLSGNMPRIHVATVHYGMGPSAFLAETWHYRGHDLYAAYQSAQIVDEPGAVGLQINQALAFPSADTPASESEGVPRGEATAMHSLVWYETDAEQKARQVAPVKPKLDLIAWVQRLPVDRRIPAMRRLGLAL